MRHGNGHYKIREVIYHLMFECFHATEKDTVSFSGTLPQTKIEKQIRKLHINNLYSLIFSVKGALCNAKLGLKLRVEFKDHLNVD